MAPRRSVRKVVKTARASAADRPKARIPAIPAPSRASVPAVPCTLGSVESPTVAGPHVPISSVQASQGYHVANPSITASPSTSTPVASSESAPIAPSKPGYTRQQQPVSKSATPKTTTPLLKLKRGPVAVENLVPCSKARPAPIRNLPTASLPALPNSFFDGSASTAPKQNPLHVAVAMPVFCPYEETVGYATPAVTNATPSSTVNRGRINRSLSGGERPSKRKKGNTSSALQHVLLKKPNNAAQWSWARSGIVLLRVLSENMTLMEGIEGSSTLATKATSKKALLLTLIKEDPRLEKHLGNEEFTQNYCNCDRARELLTACRTKVSACLARERSLTGQADERKAWEKTFGEESWVEAKRLAMTVFDGNQAVLRDFVLTSEDADDPVQETDSQVLLMNESVAGNEEVEEPEDNGLHRQYDISDSESGHDSDAFAAGGIPDVTAGDVIFSLSQEECEMVPKAPSLVQEHPRADVAARKAVIKPNSGRKDSVFGDTKNALATTKGKAILNETAVGSRGQTGVDRETALRRPNSTQKKGSSTENPEHVTDAAAADMLNAITSETTARKAAADSFEVGAVIRARGEAEESRARAAKMADEMATSRREKDMNAIMAAAAVQNNKALQRILYRRADLSEEEIEELQGNATQGVSVTL